MPERETYSLKFSVDAWLQMVKLQPVVDAPHSGLIKCWLREDGKQVDILFCKEGDEVFLEFQTREEES